MEIPHQYKLTDMVFRKYQDALYPLGAGFLNLKSELSRQSNEIPISYSFCYVASGTIFFTGSDGVQRTLGAGTVFQRWPGEVQSSEVPQESNYLEVFFELDRSWFDMMRQHGMKFVFQQVWDVGVNLRYLDEMWEIKEMLRHGGQNEIGIIIGRILTLISQMYYNSTPIPDRARINHAMAIENAVTLMSKNTDRNINLAQIARQVGLGEDTFRKEFKKNRGVSPMLFLIRSRIDRACVLLKQQQLSIKEVSEQLGYPDVYSFSRQFKKITGITPGRLR